MYFQSADEKLRSLSHKGHHSSKTNTNTYCGSQNGLSDTSHGVSVISSRSEAPDVPPPPIPRETTNQIQQNQSRDKVHHESTNQKRASLVLETSETGIPPPIYPRPQNIINMAERRKNRKSGTVEDSSVLKKRSRSEGPHGRRKLRNSMHETSNKTSQNKSTSNGRHSMYTGHLSEDDDVRAVHSGSDSPDSDITDQRWTKNPLMVRKSRKSDRTSKTDKRRSVQNVESKDSFEESGPNSYQVSNSRDLFIQPRKTDLSQSNRAKFQRMEENRKKRIDMAVTSDEECSPQLRISRLRQRAMMSSQLDNLGQDVGINIVPVRNESSFKSYRDIQNGMSQMDKSEQNRQSQYGENRQSKYDENYNIDNMNGNFYQEYTKQQGVRHNKLPNVLPEFLPENRVPVNMANRGYHGNTVDQAKRTVTGQSSQPALLRQEKQIGQKPQEGRVKVSSESPKLRSFNEIKSNNPTQLKKADQKIELNPRSPNTSSDSLDELIESNIQYLESEIENGKIKRQSGNYSNYSQENVVQRQVLREPLRSNQMKKPAEEEFRSRLQDPRSFVSNKLMSTVTKVEPKVVQRSTLYPQTHGSYGSQYPRSQQATTVTDQRHVPHSGSATYSPYMQRKTYDINEDMSKSDSHLNALNAEIGSTQNNFQVPRSFAPYPVLHKQTGNIVYIQPAESIEEQFQISDNGIVPAVDTGMFSDVEYNIEVSERIKKWEKKLTPGEVEERRKVLNTIKEYESFSDSNQKPDTPVEVRRELWQLVSPTSNSGVGKLSVNLTRSTSSMSDSSMQDPLSATYFEPKVVSSETSLHRIFRVVNEPKTRRFETKSVEKVKRATESDGMVNAQSRYKKPHEMSNYTQSMSNVTLSESEIGSNMQQSWPPIAVDSDSGIRKSWRLSRYEDEINELKELVSDNFRDIRKRFDSDMSETDTKRASPVFKEPQVVQSVTSSVPVTTQTTSGMSKLTLNIQPVTPTKPRSPVIIRRKLSDQRIDNTPPASPNVPLTPRTERKLPVYRNVPVETKSVSTAIASTPKKATVLDLKPPSSVDAKATPEVWSPNMESRKGLVSMERVKARTLQTIPFSEDPVWKEIEGLATFEKPDEICKDVNFDEIDELLKLATGGVDNLQAKANIANVDFDNHMKRLNRSETFNAPSSSQVQTLMTQSYSPSAQMQIPASSNSTYPLTHSSKHVFTPPTIQPLKLNSKSTKKSSTSALDEVLEDIRASLQKKPLSPKLMKNLDTSESNSSTNLSLQSPLTKSSKAFIFPKDVKRVKTETMKVAADVSKSSTATPGYDNTHETWKPPQNEVPAQALQQMANAPYIDPEFTQFPYIINGNYHLDPKLLSEKLKSTGLVNESSDEHSAANRNKIFIDLPANYQHLSNVNKIQTASERNKAEIVSQPQSKSHDLDQSVDDLRSLAQEVEYKLSQIKSRIVSADEDRLDSILLALRKFAPMTEQKYFNVKFTPNYESEKARRSKLEDALFELEKVYNSLDLDDKSLMDRASRREETAAYIHKHEQESSAPKNSFANQVNTVGTQNNGSDGGKVMRKSQIEEIERQTQNEFEDITKSFQVLLDEVTKQCRSVAQRSSKYFPSDSNLFEPSEPVQQYSSQRPPDEIRQEPPRQQLRLETKSPRAVQDSYNTAIKELESVAMGNAVSSDNKPIQSVVYLNIDKSKPSVQKSNQNERNATLVSPTRNLDIQVQSKTVASNKNLFNSKPNESNKFVSMATEFLKPVKTKVVKTEVPSSEANNVNNSTVSLQFELNNDKPQSRGAGRFRKRGNVEHRKSMPAITRTVETQTVETQTDPAPAVSEMKEKFEQYRKASLQEMSSDSSPDFKAVRKAAGKISGENEEGSSSSDDEPMQTSKMRRSFSCPDIVGLLEELDKKEKEKEKKLVKVDKASGKKATKSATPKSVKQRHENKLRFRSLQKDDTKTKQTENTPSDDGIESPKCKPPVYPVWKYPGQVDSPVLKKSDQRKQAFANERDFTKTASDTEQDRLSLRDTDQGTMGSDDVVIRRRSRSFGCEQDTEERPKSFHELVATFEQNPKRLEKIRASGLRKCASEDSVFTDLVLQKIYHSESDLYTDNKGHKLTGSALKLAFEMKLKD